MLYRNYKIATCADRVALCSSRASIRAFSSCRIARRVIFIITIICLLIPIHLAINFNIENNRCGPQPGAYSIFYSIYQITLSSWPPIIMIILGIISFRNLKKVSDNSLHTDSDRFFTIFRSKLELLQCTVIVIKALQLKLNHA